MSRSKKVKVKKKKKNNVVPVKKEKKALIVINRKKLSMAKIFRGKIIGEVVKKVSIAVLMMGLIAYITLMVIVATSIFYVSHLNNGLIQKGVNINRNRCFKLNAEKRLCKV